jgi:hypothetical protein
MLRSPLLPLQIARLAAGLNASAASEELQHRWELALDEQSAAIHAALQGQLDAAAAAAVDRQAELQEVQADLQEAQDAIFACLRKVDAASEVAKIQAKVQAKLPSLAGAKKGGKGKAKVRFGA